MQHPPHGSLKLYKVELSSRDIEELMARRGVVLTYETVRQWCLKFGQTYAHELRRRRPPCGDKWHLDARLSHHQWQAALPVTSRRSAWKCTRHPGAEQARQEGSQTLLLQAAQGSGICAARDHLVLSLLIFTHSGII